MNHRLKVLVIEDDSDDFLLLEEKLHPPGEPPVAILHAQRLKEALALAGANEIDVAIVDLSLPDSSGLPTFLRLKEHFPHLPVLILSGSRDHELALAAVKNGAQDYLFKSDESPKDFRRVIRHAIERQRLTSELQQALEHVKRLQGLLPICSYCKSIRDDDGYWQEIERYIASRSEAEFSHGICPRCATRYYPDIFPRKD